MAIRSQVFHYNSTAAYASGALVPIQTMAATLTQAAITKATEFVVVEKIAATPYLADTTGAAFPLFGDAIQTFYMQIVISTTGYFVRPDGLTSNGVPSQASPFPRTGQFKRAVFELKPAVYVLPGQNWELELRPSDAVAGTQTVAAGAFRAIVKYTLFDNADSQFAVELYKMGVEVSCETVDEYKRLMLEQGMQQ